MTCPHVLGLIDAGPFADYPRAHLDAAWQHARTCAGCGAALAASTRLAAALSALPQPTPPSDLSLAVMARIARIEERSPGRAEATAPDWAGWAATLAGVAGAVVVVRALPVGDVDLLATTWWPSALHVAAGIALYVIGLFAPITGRRREESRES